MHFEQWQNQISKNYSNEATWTMMMTTTTLMWIKWSEKGPSHDAPYRSAVFMWEYKKKPTKTITTITYLTRQKKVTTRKHSHMHKYKIKINLFSNHHEHFVFVYAILSRFLLDSYRSSDETAGNNSTLFTRYKFIHEFIFERHIANIFLSHLFVVW